MSRKQLTSLFISSLTIWIAGNGLLPLLPVYAETLGADQTISGLYLAFAYLAITLGAFSADKVTGNRFGRKRPLILVTLVTSPLALLMGQVGSLWALILLTGLLWFCFDGSHAAKFRFRVELFAWRRHRGCCPGAAAPDPFKLT